MTANVIGVYHKRKDGKIYDRKQGICSRSTRNASHQRTAEGSRTPPSDSPCRSLFRTRVEKRLYDRQSLQHHRKRNFHMVENRLWRKVLHENRYTGTIRAPLWKEQLPEKIPYALTEKYLLTQAFIAEGDTVRFVTYDGFKDVQIKKIHPYSYDLDDDSQIDKIQILLAFPKSRMEHLKNHIKRRADIAEYKLQAILKKSERPQIDTTAEVGDTLEIVMRDGLAFTGIVIWNSHYNVVLRVGGRKAEGGKVILLYKHGIHAFSVIKTAETDAIAPRT